MDSLLNIIKYGAVFSGIYIQVFLLLTYLGWGKGRPEIPDHIYTDDELPTVAVIVPCWNDGAGVVRTFESLLASDYPKEKLHIIFVDDGSTDDAWEVVQKYKENPQISLYHKENGGKYTANNFGLQHTQAQIVGCLDADSTVAVDAIRRSAEYFMRDAETFAVVPRMTIEHPKTFIQILQKVEFEGALYMRETFGMLGALFVAPGPLTLFRREVFERLGPYRHGYLGEDLEIAVRMQCNKMKITYGNKVQVYTFGMKTFKTLIKQRVRWTYAFIMNMKDYRRMLLNPEYGHLGLFIFPVAIMGILIAVILTPLALFQLLQSLIQYIEPLAWGVTPTVHLDSFYIPTNALGILGMIALVFVASSILLGRSLNNQKLLSWDLGTLIIYPFVSAWWMVKTMWKVARSEKVTWR